MTKQSWTTEGFVEIKKTSVYVYINMSVCLVIIIITRKHSSRMRIVRCSGCWVLRYRSRCQDDIFPRIELIPSFVLSSDNTNCKNDIQLFHQLFDELSVHTDYH